MKMRLCLLSMCSIIGCNLQPAEQNITIDKIYWIFENIPPDYGAPFSLSLDVTVKYSGSALNLDDIDYGIFTASGTTWNLLTESSFFNDSAKSIAYGWQTYNTYDLSSNGSVMPIGDYDFIVKLKNGNTFNKTFIMPAPGMKTPNGCKFIYTEDYNDQITASFFPMIKRPTVIKVFRNSDTIIAAFTINDTLVYNGLLWLYDSDTMNIGYSYSFRNITTKSISKIINNGNEIASNGDTNYVKILSENCEMNKCSNFNEIRSIRIILTDGRQYASESLSYDCRSIGSLAIIN